MPGQKKKKKNRQRATTPDVHTSTMDSILKAATDAGTLPAGVDGAISHSAELIRKTMETSLKLMMEGDEKALEDMFRPPNFSSSMVAALPLTDQTWYADVHCQTDVDNGSPSGYSTVHQYRVTLVEKEKGSNGRREVDDGDGLSLTFAFCGEKVDRSEGDFHKVNQGLLRTIAKACLSPNTAAVPMPPGRPRKVLFRGKGVAKALKAPLCTMGILETAVAESALIESMMASFAEGPPVNPVNAPGPRNSADGKAVRKAIVHNVKNTDKRLNGYVSEEREDLGSWRPLPVDSTDTINVTPLEWFARAPTRKERRSGWKPRMLWGWRTNMEIACARNDVDKLRDISKRWPAADVKEFIEMRLLLANAAHLGLLATCKVLVEVGAAINGVCCAANRPEWRQQQIASGDSLANEGNSPLMKAVESGNTSVVEFLLSKGANTELSNKSGMLPMHLAVARAHKDIVRLLLQAGSDIHARDVSGLTPAELADFLAEQQGAARFSYIASLVRGEASSLGRVCSACHRSVAGLKHCTCGLVWYCGKNCQKAHWKAHKSEHRQAAQRSSDADAGDQVGAVEEVD